MLTTIAHLMSSLSGMFQQHAGDPSHAPAAHTTTEMVLTHVESVAPTGAAIWPALLLLGPIIAVLLTTFCAIFKVKTKLPAFVTVGSLAFSFICAVMMYRNVGQMDGVSIHIFDWINFQWQQPRPGSFVADIGIYVDKLTCLWMLFVTGLATLIALYASEYMSHDVGKGYSRFFFAFSLFVLSMSCLVMADNLVLLYLGWEGVGLCSYLLIGYFYTKPAAVAAAKKAFIVNRIGDLGLALGIMLTFVQFGSVRYAELFEMAAPYIEHAKAGHFDQIPIRIQIIPLLLMIGAFGKSAQFPLYVWLPDAMEGPTPVSALIHAATMVTAGVFLIARMYTIFVLSPWALPIVAWIGTITALLSATIGMAQFDIKRIMAYSTCSQLGYMFAGLGVLSSVGAASHVFTHALFKATLFLCCGAVMHGFAGQLDLRKLSGLWKVKGWLIVSVAMFVGCINLAGFPFTAGFFSKDMIIAESFVTPGFAYVGWLLLITAGLTAYYTFRVFFRVFVGPVYYEPGDEHHDDHSDDHAHDHGDDHAHDNHGHDDHSHGFHPHAPGWAINTVLVVLMVSSLAAIPLMMKGVFGYDHGWTVNMVEESSAHYESPYAHHETNAGTSHAEDAHTAPSHDETAHATHAEGGTFLGYNPHEAMYYVSGGIGAMGILIAFLLHYSRNRKLGEANLPADKLLPMLGPIPFWAQHKWYVDEFYHFLIRRPLWVISTLFGYFDKLVVDGLVDLLGAIPRWIGAMVRPSQSGVLHGYAMSMALGIGILLIAILGYAFLM
ncbi:MAG: NADH-quinone oxidoreductase subunit L [Phycisphaeraceae bacterium]|nr:NADH-quinone oxidoreductase subunit L [Phycisphaerales bacterium]MCB9859528.1 NADH-quinone oxidoreductase subunit L [Phycisphaeraceae bacterium]